MRIGTERMSRIFPLWLWNEHLTRYLFAADFVAGKIVVDCACGAGIGASIFLEKGAMQLLGFDVSPAAIALAHSNNQKAKQGSFSVADGNDLPVENEFTDVFISLETIEHIDQAEEFLREARRVLKNDGVFVCSTPNRTVTNPGIGLDSKPWNKFHIREYTQTEFSALLQTEFEQVQMYGFNKLSLTQLAFENKIRKIFRINGYVWTNLKKFWKIFRDDLGNYQIEKVNARYEYEYLVAVCRKS